MVKIPLSKNRNLNFPDSVWKIQIEQKYNLNKKTFPIFVTILFQQKTTINEAIHDPVRATLCAFLHPLSIRAKQTLQQLRLRLQKSGKLSETGCLPKST